MERKVVITGASQGIGKEIADLLHNEGYYVINADIAVQKNINDPQKKFSMIQCDISDYSSVKTMMEYVKDYVGGFDVLINNAGITSDSLLEKMNIAQWEKIIQTNLNGTFYCCKEAIPYLKVGDAPRIVNIASLSGIYVNKGQANYGVSKAGIIELTKYLAVELAKYGILVNGVAPGVIQTKILDTIPEYVLDGMKKVIPIKRFGTCSEIAKVVSFLCDKKLEYVTGEIINVAGGLKL